MKILISLIVNIVNFVADKYDLFLFYSFDNRYIEIRVYIEIPMIILKDLCHTKRSTCIAS